MNQDMSLRKYAVITSGMASFLTPFMGSAINLAIPSIGTSFNSSAALLSWVISIYLLTTAALLLPFGRLADIHGRKRVFAIGLLLFSFSSLLCGRAWSIQSLIVFRIFQGIGASMIYGTGMTVLTSIYPSEERGKALGINVSCTYIGLSLGPTLGGMLNHHLGWQSVFYFNALLGTITYLFTITKLKGEWVGAKDEKFDLLGAFLFSTGLIAALYGFSSIVTSFIAKYLLMFGVGLIAVFVRYELKTKYPILNITLISKNVTFALSNLAALINYCATFAVGLLLSLHLQVIVGFNSQKAGLIMLAQPIIMALLSPFAGRLSDRVEPRVVASVGMILTAMGLLFFSLIREDTPTWEIILALAVLGIGFAFFSSPNSSAVMGSVDKKFYGIASSTLGTMRLIGQTISIATATLIIDIYTGNNQLSPAIKHLLEKSISVSFTVFAITCFLGVFASLARGKINS